MLAGMLAVATGIVATTRLGSLPGAAPLIAALPLLVPLLFSTRAALRTGGCLLLGLALGMLRGHEMLARALPAELEGQDLAVRVCVEGLPERFLDVRGERWRFRARVLDALPGARGAWAARQGRRVELSWYGAGDFRPGDAWSMTVRLRAPRGFVNPGGRDYQAWLLAEGIDASGYVVGKAPHARLAARGCGAHLDRLRWSLRTRLAELVGNEPQFGKLLAVTIGDDSRFRPSDWEVFALTGTTHLMVISGMHITLVAMLALLGAKAGSAAVAGTARAGAGAKCGDMGRVPLRAALRWPGGLVGVSAARVADAGGGVRLWCGGAPSARLARFRVRAAAGARAAADGRAANRVLAVISCRCGLDIRFFRAGAPANAAAVAVAAAAGDRNCAGGPAAACRPAPGNSGTAGQCAGNSAGRPGRGAMRPAWLSAVAAG
ncbi:MAG: ComEC/Rec2 family competence protein [Gammaproteobacteria bacterium]|nr:ComEC/Rec2 family competence protein [Gammaproteobacteria bacterium]